MPEVSVVLPFKNEAKYLKESIRSIQKQSLRDWELIMVDNGSVDGSKEIAISFSEKDQRIKYFYEPKGGVAKAFNHGFEESNSPLIARMDGDDICHPLRLETQVKALKELKNHSVCYSKVKPCGSPKFSWLRYLVWQNSILNSNDIYLNRFVEMPVCNPSLMAHRDIWETSGLYSEEICPEDYDLFLKFCKAGFDIQKINEPLIEWRDHEERLTWTHSGYSRENFFRVKAQYLLYESQKKNSNHPVISIWGAGRVAKGYLDILSSLGFLFKNIYDLREGHTKWGPTKKYSAIQAGEFLISLVSNRGAGEKIRRYLGSRGLNEGEDFLLAG